MNGLTVVIPTLNAAGHLSRCVSHLEGGVRVVVADGGSNDSTRNLAEAHGATVVDCERGRGTQLATGAKYALGDGQATWLLFLHADTALEPGWRLAADAFMAEPANRYRVAVFRFGLDDNGPEARRLAAMVAWRVRWLALPYGDQGLLIHRDFYHVLGGYKPMPLMEDVDIIRRIGRRRFTVLGPAAITSAERWRREGWLWRSTRNVACLALYFAGFSANRIKKFYG